MNKLGFETNKRIHSEWNNQRKSAEIDGKVCHFRSKLEYNWALYCQFRKEQGLIKDWWYEQTTFRFEEEAKKQRPGVIVYLVDFDIRNNDDTFHYEECKGRLTGKDREKFRKVAKYYPDTKIHLVMQNISKRDMNGIRIAEKYVARVVNAREVFRQVKGLLEFA